MYKWGNEKWLSSSFIWVSYEKPRFSYRVMSYFGWVSSGNLKLIIRPASCTDALISFRNDSSATNVFSSVLMRGLTRCSRYSRESGTSLVLCQQFQVHIRVKGRPASILEANNKTEHSRIFYFWWNQTQSRTSCGVSCQLTLVRVLRMSALSSTVGSPTYSTLSRRPGLRTAGSIMSEREWIQVTGIGVGLGGGGGWKGVIVGDGGRGEVRSWAA